MKLRKLEESDAKFMYEWMTESDVNNYFRFNPKNVTISSCKEFIVNSYTEKDQNYAIDINGEYAGTISLKNINYEDMNSEYAISLRKKFRGKGYGFLASIELLKIAFDELKLNKVYLNVLSTNDVANNMYVKIGFEYEGELKEHININGEYKSLKLYGMLRSSYEKKYKNN